MKTLYDVLEVSALASKEAIDTSYHRLIKEFQQQLETASGNPIEITLRLDAINRAYSLLASPDKRREYDERIRGNATLGACFDNQYSDGFPSYLIGLTRKPLALILTILAIIYVVSDNDIKSDHTATMEKSDIRHTEASERIAIKGLDVADKTVEYETQSQNRRTELENERLRRQAELLRLEQARKDRELEYKANAEHRLLEMEERKLNIAEREIEAEREHVDAVRNIEYVSRAIELQKDAAAARLGITRTQYDKIKEEKWTESSGWNN